MRSASVIRASLRRYRYKSLRLRTCFFFQSWLVVHRHRCCSVQEGLAMCFWLDDVSRVCSASLMMVDRECAQSRRALRAFLSVRKPFIRRDKLHSLGQIADTAQRASNCGDTKKLYSIVQSLAGKGTAPIKAIADETGRILTCDGEVRSRWRRHFVEAFKAEVLPDIRALGIARFERGTALIAERISKRRRKKQRPDLSLRECV